jgi:uncharacterized protein
MSSETRSADEPTQPTPVGGPPPAEVTPDDRQWGLFAHLSALAASAVTGLGFLGPLIIWLVRKDKSSFVDDQGKEALNFQINLLIHALVIGVIAIVTCGFGALLFIPWAVYALVMPILAGLQANKGERYRYPLTWRIIK